MKLHHSKHVIKLFILISFAYRCSADNLILPKGLLIGVSTSAYQAEGAWNLSDKGESIWDRFTHSQPHKILNRSNGDTACDSYHKYKEDVQLLRMLGVNFYRFSISWPRILPTGYANVVSREGIKYYNNLIDELVKYNITPMATLYHWDHPQVFQEMGGWTNEVMVDLFGDYARVVFREFGDRVKVFSTINEPNIVCQFTYSYGIMPPGVKLGKHAEYLCNHNVLKAHARAYHIYDEEFRAQQNGKIGIVLLMYSYFSRHASDELSADIAFQFGVGVHAHPIFSEEGDYPAVMKQRVAENSRLDQLERSRLPTFTKEWISYIKGSADFLGVNHYTSAYAEPAVKTNHTIDEDDSGITLSFDDKWPLAAGGFIRVHPEGFSALLRKLKKDYNNPEIYIMENGFPDDGLLEDNQRIEYLYLYMKSMLQAINEYGCNVRAYSIWSLMDTFEWTSGYNLKFGLFSVNFSSPNKERTPKASAFWLRNVIRARKLLPIPQKMSAL